MSDSALPPEFGVKIVVYKLVILTAHVPEEVRELRIFVIRLDSLAEPHSPHASEQHNNNWA